MVAQELALSRPERVDRLVLACTTPGGPKAYPMPETTVALLAEATTLEPAVALRRFVENALTPATVAARPEIVERIMAHRLATEPESTVAAAAIAFSDDNSEPVPTRRGRRPAAPLSRPRRRAPDPQPVAEYEPDPEPPPTRRRGIPPARPCGRGQPVSSGAIGDAGDTAVRRSRCEAKAGAAGRARLDRVRPAADVRRHRRSVERQPASRADGRGDQRPSPVADGWIPRRDERFDPRGRRSLPHGADPDEARIIIARVRRKAGLLGPSQGVRKERVVMYYFDDGADS